jgi:hypothetical protein
MVRVKHATLGGAFGSFGGHSSGAETCKKTLLNLKAETGDTLMCFASPSPLDPFHLVTILLHTQALAVVFQSLMVLNCHCWAARIFLLSTEVRVCYVIS